MLRRCDASVTHLENAGTFDREQLARYENMGKDVAK